MNVTDVISLCLLTFAIFYGIYKGCSSLLVKIASIIASIYFIVYYGVIIKQYVIQHFNVNTLLANAIAYALIIFATMFLAKLVIFVIKKILNFFDLNFLDRILGIFFMAGIILIVLSTIIFLFDNLINVPFYYFDDSIFVSFIRNEIIAKSFPKSL